jgi:hypothetical protein
MHNNYYLIVMYLDIYSFQQKRRYELDPNFLHSQSVFAQQHSPCRRWIDQLISLVVAWSFNYNTSSCFQPWHIVFQMPLRSATNTNS